MNFLQYLKDNSDVSNDKVETSEPIIADFIELPELKSGPGKFGTLDTLDWDQITDQEKLTRLIAWQAEQQKKVEPHEAKCLVHGTQDYFECEAEIWPFPWAPGFLRENKSDETLEQLKGLFSRMGAKSVLRSLLVSLFPGHNTYVEPFAGSFKVLLWKKNRSKIEIVNDADNYLINFWRYVKTQPLQLVQAINALPLSEHLYRVGHAEIRTLSPFQQAVVFYYIARLSFNGVFRPSGSVYASSPYTRPNHIADLSNFLKTSARLIGVDIRCAPYHRVIKQANKPVSGKVFFYLDPPYYRTETYRTTDGKLPFTKQTHTRLAEICKEIDAVGNLFLMTNSNHPEVRAMYDGFNIYEQEVYYSISTKAKKRKKNTELIITNYDVTWPEVRSEEQMKIL